MALDHFRLDHAGIYVTDISDTFSANIAAVVRSVPDQ